MVKLSKVGTDPVIKHIVVPVAIGFACIATVIAIHYRSHLLIDRSGPYGVTRARMDMLASHIQRYRLEAGSWPDENAWESQLLSLRYSSGIWHPTNIMRDAWGKKIRYQVRTHDKVTDRVLRSDGPNKVDEYGLGDDMIVIINTNLAPVTNFIFETNVINN